MAILGYIDSLPDRISASLKGPTFTRSAITEDKVRNFSANEALRSTSVLLMNADASSF